MASCSYSALFESVSRCGASSKNPQNIQCVVISECTKDVYPHVKSLKIGPDEAIRDESTLLLARAAICKRCREHLQEIVETDPIDPSPEPTEASSCLQVPSSCETQHDEDNSENSEKESAKESSTSEELAREMEFLQIGEESFVPLSQTASETSSSVENEMSLFDRETV
ncbi:hypothetical protein OS493_034888 [Desmophyllum pertusum]|uniref:Uncharacterized protein n=1 Tax=Desmophyllum pertusum TaxID=174260 RepID=A0A9X0D0P9_9CNID|nr:hypothetical protein OS493_034888 [Desmophyllum pertusum]